MFSDDYCRRHGLLVSRLSVEPDEITHPTEREVTRWTRCRRVVNPRAGQRVGTTNHTAGQEDR